MFSLCGFFCSSVILWHSAITAVSYALLYGHTFWEHCCCLPLLLLAFLCNYLEICTYTIAAKYITIIADNAFSNRLLFWPWDQPWPVKLSSLTMEWEDWCTGKTKRGWEPLEHSWQWRALSSWGLQKSLNRCPEAGLFYLWKPCSVVVFVFY